MGVGDPAELRADGIGDAAAAVADVDDDRAAGGVEVGASVGVPDRRALGADGDGEGAPGGAGEDAARDRVGSASWLMPRVYVGAGARRGARRTEVRRAPPMGERSPAGRGGRSRPSAAVGQTRPLGTVCQYVLLKTILPRCQTLFGFGGLGGWS